MSERESEFSAEELRQAEAVWFVMKRDLRINVGTSILDAIWKGFVIIAFGLAIWVAAQNHTMSPPSAPSVSH